jgi:hypothetical protein
MPEPGVKSTHIAARRDAGAAGTMPLKAFFIRLGTCGKVDAAFRTARDGFSPTLTDRMRLRKARRARYLHEPLTRRHS